MKFDYANDPHVDFYVKHDANIQKYEKKTRNHALTVLPEQPSDTLIIGGDVGEYNIQNFFFISELAKYYKRIFIVFGNHDYYLTSTRQEKKYKRSSYRRVEEMKEMYKSLPNVYVLEGDVVEVDGIRIGGLGMWYDFSYGQREHGLSYDDVYRLWWKNSTDSKKVRGIPNPIGLYENSISQLEHVIKNSDVIVTHMGPDWSLYKLQPDDRDDFTEHFNYYFFDGSPYYSSLQGKTWLFGHVHYDLDEVKYGCRFISHAIGYPDQRQLTKQFKTIEI